MHPEEGTYVIATGDFPSTIAVKFKVKFEDLLAINGWTLGSGEPGARVLRPSARRSRSRRTGPSRAPLPTPPTGNATPPGETTTTVAGGSVDVCAGEYTIVEGDYLGKVAKKLDTTVEALNAANANTRRLQRASIRA